MLKIILADNQAIFRAGIAKVLAVEDDVRIVAQAQTVEQAMIAIEKFRGSVMIYASSFLPDAEQLAAQARESGIQLVVIAENNEQPDRYLRAGVLGLIYRSVESAELLRCVRKVSAGEVYVQDLRAAAAQRRHRRLCRRAGARPPDAQGTEDRRPDRAGLQEQGNRQPARHHRAGGQELSAQCV